MGGSLSDAVTRLSEVRFGETTAREIFDLVVQAATEISSDAAGATLTLPGSPAAQKLTPIAATHDRYLNLPYKASPTEYAIGHGIQLRTGDDLSRWPTFAHDAATLGIRDIIVSPFRLHATHRGCLNVYSPGCFGQQATAAIDVLVRHAGGIIANVIAFEELARTNDQLNEGLRSRELIGLAKGILMRQERCSEADAFRILVSGSQRLNRKVREVAQDVIALTEGRADLTRGRHD